MSTHPRTNQINNKLHIVLDNRDNNNFQRGSTKRELRYRRIKTIMGRIR